MKHSPIRCLNGLLGLFATVALSAPQPDNVVKLAPFIVTDIKPVVKIAELPMVEPRFGAAIVAEGDYLYIIGGSNSEGTRLDTVERVDLRTGGRASPWAKLQVARRHHRAIIANGKIYVLGGTSGPVDPLNPLSEELSDYFGDDDPVVVKGDLPPIARPATLVSYSYEPSVELIDLQTGRVNFGPAMPVPKAMFGCVMTDGKILVIGGQKRKGDTAFCTNTTEIFDVATNTWSAGVNMPTPRRCTATLVDGFVMVLGGYRGTRPLRTVEVFNPREKVWRRLPDLPHTVNPSATVWAGHYLFLFGDQGVHTRQLVYDLRSKQLVPYPLELPDSDFAAALLHAGKIYLVGGADLRRHFTSDGIQIFAPTVETIAPLDQATQRK